MGYVATPRRADGSASIRVFTKGAAEVVLGLCARRLGPGGAPEPLPPAAAAALLAGFQQGGQRLLCLAYRDVTAPTGALPAVAQLICESLDGEEDEPLSPRDVATLESLEARSEGAVGGACQQLHAQAVRTVPMPC